jgi:hypothetical protein
VTWNAEVGEAFDFDGLRAKLEAAPEGIYRIKGGLSGVESGLEFHRVGRSVEIARVAQPEVGRVVGIGPAAKIKAAQIEAWWTGGA